MIDDLKEHRFKKARDERAALQRSINRKIESVQQIWASIRKDQARICELYELEGKERSND